MRVDDLDYNLPPELIAQAPARDRAASRLLNYRRADRSIAHHIFSDLPSLLRADDLLVMNDARVTPARFTLIKPTGGKVEALFVEQRTADRAHLMLKNLGLVKPDAWLAVDGDFQTAVRVIDKFDGGLYEVELRGGSLVEMLARVGRMPLPPYIKRERGADSRAAVDSSRYQTVYAQTPGSIAAPTAGLHFTPEVFAMLDARRIERAFVTLHVGLGTFKPIEVDDLAQHPMHAERYSLSATACDSVNRALRDGRRIVAVGTTSARALESIQDSELHPHEGQTQLLIQPPYTWRRVGAMVTNFHQPRSTLLALVAALIGLDELHRVYRDAIAQRYRFFSYGDAMFIE